MLRSRILAVLVFTLAACGTRPRPYRFASPMLGQASVPTTPLPLAPDDSKPEHIGNSRRADPIRVATGARGVHDASAPRVREVSAAPVMASAAAADAIVANAPVARDDIRAQLPAPNRTDLPQPPVPPVRQPSDLRALVGRRDARDPIAAARGWAYDLGMTIDASTSDGRGVVVWAEANNRLHDASEPPERGDLLVFDRVNSDDEADLIGVVIGRDERNVTELVYLGGGVIRRGFVDASRPATRRDKTGAVVNTFLRTGKRWPAKGSHYLAGEHLAHVIR